ncbi:MAG TPA: RNA polymerase sigma factor region1.1 domain-containing protein, partial [Xanthobacteraceae bacterium]|nr:RNA polymerase sigma factor region1.1 domain-containing protein [Xanthobacteraceae bacterium]
MANVIKASFQREKGPVPDKDQPEVTADGPLLDLADAEVTKMIKRAKKRGYITHQQINAVLPSDEHTSEKIENILAMLNDMGINTVEQD